MTDQPELSILTRDVKEYEGYPRGSVIFREGDRGGCMYAVHTGRVELRTGNHVLEVVGSGSVFGEMILVGRFERSATAIALEDSQLVPIDQSRFDQIIQRNPNLARELMWLMAERLTAMNERLRTGG